MLLTVRWSVGRGSAAVATQFYSIAIRCNVSSVDISNCPVEHIDALGLVVYHNDTKEVHNNNIIRGEVCTSSCRKLMMSISNSELHL